MPVMALLCLPFEHKYWSRTRETSQCRRLRSRKRPAPTQSAPLTSSDEDVQPLSRLRSYASQRSRLNSNTGNVSEDTKSKRSSRRLSTARNGKGALASDDDPEEEQDEPAPARRRSLRSRSDVPVDHGAASQKQVQAPAGSHSGPSTRAASRSNRAQPTEQEDQPERALRSRSTRAASRAKAAAPQHDSSPEESSDEGSEPQRLRQRSARASRQARKASKLVQGGGGISDDDDSASGVTYGKWLGNGWRADACHFWTLSPIALAFG